MRRSGMWTLLACGAAFASAAAMQLNAQPEPYKPLMNDGGFELTLPPGTYQTLIIAFEGGSNTKTLKTVLKAPSGDMTLLVGAGETLTVPLSAAAGWTITQPVVLKLTQPISQAHVTAISAAGPVKLEPAKK